MTRRDKVLTSVSLMIVSVVLMAQSSPYIAREYWGFGGTTLSQTWVSPDGRMDTQIQVPGNSTALDMWPANAPMASQDSVSEITLHRYPWQSPVMERLNISAMVDHTDGGAYRIGVERANGGQFRPILFCFENVTPGVASCPLKIGVEGVYVLTTNGFAQISATGYTAQ